MSLFAELKRRNVIRVAVAYLVASWLLIEASSLILGIYEAPLWVSQVIVSLLAVGFPVALIFSWVFEMTPDGLKRESEITPDASAAAHTAKKLDVATIVLVIAAVVVLAMDRFVFDRGQEATPTVMDRGTAPAATLTTASAIAVLPFADMSANGDQAYFADGIAEEILNLLAKNPELRVVARTSAFRYRGEEFDLREIGGALDANRVLEGSVRTSGTRVRITAQLINVEDGYHIWSETYDRELTDIFAVQDEIAGAITDALGVHLGVAASAQATVGTDVDAYHLYLQGRKALHERATPGRLADAITLLTQAVTADPELAVAHGTRTLAIALSPWYTNSTRPDAYASAMASADIALELDPENVEALVAKGYALSFLGFQVGGLQYLERALELRPNDLMANNLAGDVYRAMGDTTNALIYDSRAVELDPLDAVQHWDLAWTLQEAGRFEESLVSARRATALTPGNTFSERAEVRALLQLGRVDAARARLDEAVAHGHFQAINEVFDRLSLAVITEDEVGIQTQFDASVAAFDELDVGDGARALLAFLIGDMEMSSDFASAALAARDANFLTYPRSVGLLAELEAAGHPVTVPPELKQFLDIRATSEAASQQSIRADLIALREEYQHR
jgi:TolB-like protein/Flp pilus assembly protein TadD